MFYHIGRMLIDENFDGGNECPVCRIRQKAEYRLAEQYLGEGVMEDDTRKEVNELGFCLRHFDMLYKMHSKLGLALQTSTRLKTLDKLIIPPKTAGQAKKQSAKIKEKTTDCVVCKYLNEHMVRYYKTIAEVFAGDPSFKKRISDGQGFCIGHYADLLQYSSYAGSKAKDYISTIYEVQKKRMEKLDGQIADFCNHHDYRNASTPLGEAKDALPNARKTIYGCDD